MTSESGSNTSCRRTTVPGKKWQHTLKHPNFDATKRKLLWMQNGGTAGIEIDDVLVIPTP